MRKMPICLCSLLLLAVPAFAGDDFDIPWYTIDGGGEVLSIGGAFELSGTIGQWDASRAGELSGGQWQLTGGFWGLPQVGAAGLLFRDGFEGGG